MEVGIQETKLPGLPDGENLMILQALLKMQLQLCPEWTQE